MGSAVFQILDEEQSRALQAAIDANHFSRKPIESTEELTTFTELVSFLGKGESACLAVAQQRGLEPIMVGRAWSASTA